jgi:hypothetical protein
MAMGSVIASSLRGIPIAAAPAKASNSASRASSAS